MNVSAAQHQLSDNTLWHNLSCNWIWGVVLLLCCLLMSIDSASSTSPQDISPLRKVISHPQSANVSKTQPLQDTKQVKPMFEPPKPPSGKKVELDGVT